MKRRQTGPWGFGGAGWASARLEGLRGVTAREASYFVAIAANGHRAPAAAMSPGRVAKEKAAGGVRADTKPSGGALDENFGGGAGDGSKQPV